MQDNLHLYLGIEMIKILALLLILLLTNNSYAMESPLALSVMNSRVSIYGVADVRALSKAQTFKTISITTLPIDAGYGIRYNYYNKPRITVGYEYKVQWMNRDNSSIRFYIKVN